MGQEFSCIQKEWQSVNPDLRVRFGPMEVSLRSLMRDDGFILKASVPAKKARMGGRARLHLVRRKEEVMESYLIDKVDFGRVNENSRRLDLFVKHGKQILNGIQVIQKGNKEEEKWSPEARKKKRRERQSKISSPTAETANS